MKSIWIKSTLGLLGLLLLTAPFIWLQLNYDYSKGTLVAQTNFFRGWQFLKNLAPLLTFIIIIFLSYHKLTYSLKCTIIII